MDPLASSRVGGGFSHLVEAAAALEALKVPNQSPAKASLVSDEDAPHPKRAKTSKQFVNASKKKTASKTVFPEHLMSILNDAQLSDTITWLPHGRSFVVLRPDIFMKKVVPVYLPSDDTKAGTTKYASFTRKLNRW